MEQEQISSSITEASLIIRTTAPRPTADELLEHELTCPICTDLLFDPITFLPCLHTNCGSCARQWFSRTSTNSPQHHPPHQQQQNKPHTCPVCRKRVRRTATSSLVMSLLEGYLRLHPERQRTEEEIAGMRGVWSPGDELLPQGGSGGVDSEDEDAVQRARAFTTSLGGVVMGSGLPGGESRRTMQTIFRQRAERANRAPSRTEPNSPSSPVFQLPYYPNNTHNRRASTSTSTPATPSPPSPPRTGTLTLTPSLRRSRTPTPREPPDPNLPAPTSVLEILSRGINPIIITCDGCSERLDTFVHLECGICPLYHLCLRCSLTLSPPHPHPLHRQKLHSTWPRRYLITGIFCDVCDAWCDEDRNHHSGRLSSVFFHCKTCNNGNWAYCLRCVQRGWSCSHELELWSNSRINPPLSSPLLRGNPAAIPTLALLQRLDYAPWSPLLLSTPSSTSSSPSSSSISLDQPPPPSRSCAVCKLTIDPTRSSLLHCFQCPDSTSQVCTTCYYNRERQFPDRQRARHRFFECPWGHVCGVLAVRGEEVVVHRAVGAHVGRPRVPEWVMHCGDGARRAVAVKGYWPDEGGVEERGNGEDGERRWGRGQWLCFPVGAEVEGVVRVFGGEEGEGGGEVVAGGRPDDVEEERMRRVQGGWCWGSFAGTVGLFPEECVRFL